MHYAINYSNIRNHLNGIINYSLEDNGVPYYEDTCSFTCNTGFELTGSDTRTCQSDESCRRGIGIFLCMM